MLADRSLFAQAAGALVALGVFQMNGGYNALTSAAYSLGLPWNECAYVFDYGRKKYAEWNWLRGMAWSAVISSCARHLLAMAQGEEMDPESGLSHRGHAMCNLVMLMQYHDSYAEGDDRPKPVHKPVVVADGHSIYSGYTDAAGPSKAMQEFAKHYGHTLTKKGG